MCPFFKHEIELGSIWVGKSKGFRGEGPKGIAVIGGTVAWFVRHTLRKGSHMWKVARIKRGTYRIVGHLDIVSLRWWPRYHKTKSIAENTPLISAGQKNCGLKGLFLLLWLFTGWKIALPRWVKGLGLLKCVLKQKQELGLRLFGLFGYRRASYARKETIDTWAARERKQRANKK